MLEAMIKCLGIYLTIMSCIGVFYLIKNKNRVILFFLPIVVFSAIWRSASQNNSSRYYALFLVFVFFLSAYATKHIKISFFNKRINSLIKLFLTTIIPFIFFIEDFSSFRNIYVFDIIETKEILLSEKNGQNNLLFYDEKLKRLKDTDNPSQKKSLFELPTNYDDLSEFHLKYASSSGNTFLILSQRINLKDKQSNQFPFIKPPEALIMVGNFYSNQKHSGRVSLYKLAPYTSNFRIEIINSSFLNTPGNLMITGDQIETSDGTKVLSVENGFIVKGIKNRIYSKKSILISAETLQTSVKVKNIGKTDTSVYVGFDMCSQNQIRLASYNFPFNNINKILNVIQAESGSDKIIVDTMPEWARNCFLAIHAKEDLSDVPNTSLLEGQVLDVKANAEDQVQITLSKPLNQSLEKGTKIRLHGKSSNPIYCNTEVLHPGEERTFSSSVKWNADFHQYSANGFSKDAFYVMPLLFSYSLNLEEENTVLIEDFNIKY